MANNKPAPKNWNDVQVVIATASMVTTLACWNMFAGPDRASSLERAQEQATVEPVIVASASATTVPQVGKIFFGGTEPQQIVVVAQQSHNNGGGGGGGGGNNGGASDPGSGGAPVAPPGGGTGGS